MGSHLADAVGAIDLGNSDMKRAIHGMVLATLLAGASSGCQTFGTPGTGMASAGRVNLGTSVQTATVRGQSPATEETQATGEIVQAGRYVTPIRSLKDEIHDHHHEHHNTDVYHFHGQDGQLAGQPVGGPHYGGPGCPPEGYGNCPPGYRHGCRDGFSYNYRVPNDLVYPQQNAVGGAVIYPYYTHRGPSDFFRAE